MATPATLILPYYDVTATAAGSSVKYTLVGRSMNRISYRRYNSSAAGCPAIPDNDTTSSVNTRAQASIDIRSQVKAPGALGNDRMRISLKDTFLGADGLYHTDSCEVSFSLSRDINSDQTRRNGLIIQLIRLLDKSESTMRLSNASSMPQAALAQANAKLGWLNIARMNLDLVENTATA